MGFKVNLTLHIYNRNDVFHLGKLSQSGCCSSRKRLEHATSSPLLPPPGGGQSSKTRTHRWYKVEEIHGYSITGLGHAPKRIKFAALSQLNDLMAGVMRGAYSHCDQNIHYMIGSLR